MNMETIPVVVFLANGSQVTGYFRNKSTSAPSSPTQGTKSPVASVADLRQFIDTASGQDTQSYQLLMISPSHKPLDDPEELLCPSSVVQVPVEKEKKKKKVNFDSDAEDGSSFYRRRVSTGVPLFSGPYYDQIMLAFLFTATNLAGVALLALIYFNVVMFWPYITPFFWAMVVGLALRAPRDKIVSYLAPLAQIEDNTKSLTLTYFRKLQYVVLGMVKNRNLPFILVGVLSYLMLSVLYTSMLGSWKPVVAGVSIIFGILILTLIIFSPPTFAAILLLGTLTILASTLCIFATTSLFQEGLALLNLLEPHFKYLSDRNFAMNTLEMMGLGGEYQTVLESLHEVVFTKLNTTAGQWGLNISNITSLPNLTELSTVQRDNLPGFAELMNYDYSALLELITSSWAVTTRNVVIEVSSWAFGTGLYALKVVARFSTSFYNMVIAIIVFGTSLFLMLVSNKNWVAEAIRMIPVANVNNRTYDQLQQVFTGIVLTTFVTCGANAVCTYFIVAWGANFLLPFMYTFVNALITLFPVAYPWLLQVPLVLHLYWGGQWIRGTGVSVLFMALAFLDAKLYTALAPAPTSSSSVFPHQWVSGLSVVMGLYAFGAQGILIGPILVYVTIILYKGIPTPKERPQKEKHFAEKR
eukprot:Phypoly_transcript_04444.p1 GENE.Phypoly_transcript_04444~~Phypoly_transcript_04444.p1  ORF type:complete len:640 (+),score=73.98 Phypoly_transcript_04444:91-2010(+)